MTAPPARPDEPARARALTSLGTAARSRIDAAADWITPLADDLDRIGATWQESAQVCSATAWHARRVGRDTAGELAEIEAPPRSFTEPRWRPRWHLYCTALRFDFRCRALDTALHGASPLDVESADPYIRAHTAFAVLGQSKPAGLTMLDRLLADPEAAGSREVLHVVLHGLWLGHLLPHRPQRILRVASLGPLARPADPIALMRTAAALRQLGRYRAALATIDDAIDALPAGDATVHADLVRERTLITTALDLTRDRPLVEEPDTQ
ncbi:hypothetical protein VSR01_28070 [Actinacidiphila sp. DG2A-62]|uniref:hypothetical protein n=1 Tax=Actinacidiphila sp. DG2A-62 TaxID=3108821 RepID=UPI002DB5E474|nr:hypothetical protein [Actinacidiphila sp. DG2A-62]MEC3997149.1 hypothetical protein [Actinacidiphila sp. DG2A-62]